MLGMSLLLMFAAPPVDADERALACRGFAALEQALPRTDIDRLVRWCETGDTGDAEALGRIVHRVLASGDDHFPILEKVLHDHPAMHLRSHVECDVAVSRFAQRVRDDRGEMKNLQRRIDAIEGIGMYLPLWANDASAEVSAKCQGKLLIAVVAPRSAKLDISLTTGGSAPLHDDLRAEHIITLPDAAVFLTVGNRDAPVGIHMKTEAAPAGSVYNVVLSSDALIYLRHKKVACIDLQALVSKSAHIFVNGTRLADPDTILFLPPLRYTISAVAYTSAPWRADAVQYRREVDLADPQYSGARCTPVYANIKRADKKTVHLRIDTGESCLVSPIEARALANSAMASRWMRAFNYVELQTLSIETMLRLRPEVERLIARDDIREEPGVPTSLEAFNLLTRELYNQGIDNFVSLEMSCDSEGQMIVVGERIVLDDVRSASGALGAALDPKRFHHATTNRWRGTTPEQQLYAVLYALFDAPYVAPRTAEFEATATVRTIPLVVSMPARLPADITCTSAVEVVTPRGVRLPIGKLALTRSDTFQMEVPDALVLSAGQYSVSVQTACTGKAGVSVVGSLMVSSERRTRRRFSIIGGAGAKYSRHIGINPFFSLGGAFDVMLREDQFFIGALFAYERSFLQGQDFLSWDDELTAAADGPAMSGSWKRHALLLGPRFGVRIRVRRRARVEISMMPIILNLGLVDARNAPDGWVYFRDGAGNFKSDIDIDAMLDIGGSFYLARSLGLNMSVYGGMSGYDDTLSGVSITNLPLVQFGARVGVELWR